LETYEDRSDEMLTVCGWCKKIKIADQKWVEAEEVVEELKVVSLYLGPQLTHGICPDCKEQFYSQLPILSERGSQGKTH
jgi:hypothetical protein